MNEAFIFSYYLPTQPALEVPLYNELVGRGIKVSFVLAQDDPRLKNNYFVSMLPSSLVAISNPKQLNKMMNDKDLLICRFGYKGFIGDMARLVKMSRKNVLMYDVGGVDIFFREVPATYLIAKTEWYKQQTLKKIGAKYKDIFSIGSIQFDDIFRLRNKVNRDVFAKIHGIDCSKKIAVLIPANPGEAYMAGIKDDYRKIVEVVGKCKEYELIIKGHPSDYALTKSLHYNGKHSWETFAPKSKIIGAEYGYEALAICDVVLNIRSSLALEIPILYKPLININSHKYVINWSKSNNPGVMKNIGLDKLEVVLNAGDYFVDNKACSAYTNIYCDLYADGKAYIRTADIIMKLLS